MANLLFGMVLIALTLMLLYYLWKWCSEAEEEISKGSHSGRLSMKPVYAHEIEPGIVVLQSEDGEYFKILKEYDMTGTGSRYGSLSITRPEVQQPIQERRPYATGSSVMMSPPHGNDSFQTRAPSAPSELLRLDTDHGQPPPYVY